MTSERAIAFVDGFNLYHAIDGLNRPHLKWIDLRALAHSFLRDGQVLIAVKYYTAYATWLPGAYARHREYVAALKASGVHVLLSEFRDRPSECYRCGHRWIGHEEKQTDVQMAVDIVADCLENRFDLALVITADSDLTPAISRVRTSPGKRLLMIAPPGRFNRARDLQFTHQIRRGRIARFLLPAVVTGDGQVVATRPPEYDPPR